MKTCDPVHVTAMCPPDYGIGSKLPPPALDVLRKARGELVDQLNHHQHEAQQLREAVDKIDLFMKQTGPDCSSPQCPSSELLRQRVR